MKISEIITINGERFVVRGNVVKAMFSEETQDDERTRNFYVGDAVEENADGTYDILRGEIIAVAYDIINTVRVIKCKPVEDKDEDDEDDDDCDCACDDDCDSDDE